MNKKPEELIKNIQAMIKCPHCGSRYTKENINIIGQMGQAVLVQLNCHVCKMPVTATIVVKDIYQDADMINSGQASLSVRADRDVTENLVSSDEIIEMHDFLRSFSGNFEQLFGKHKR